MAAATGSVTAKGFALWREAMRWQRSLDTTLAPLELTHTQYLLLSTADALVDETKDAISQRQIARSAGLDEVTTSRVVRSLCERGLLGRETSSDQRKYRVMVTRKGRQLVRRASPDVDAASKRFFAEQRADDARDRE